MCGRPCCLCAAECVGLFPDVPPYWVGPFVSYFVCVCMSMSMLGVCLLSSVVCVHGDAARVIFQLQCVYADVYVSVSAELWSVSV